MTDTPPLARRILISPILLAALLSAAFLTWQVRVELVVLFARKRGEGAAPVPNDAFVGRHLEDPPRGARANERVPVR